MASFLDTTPQLKVLEGGLSDKTSDKASADPVPVKYYDPVSKRSSDRWHTKSGVTWTTFKALAKTIGYVATPELFFKMPTEIWLKIFKIGFWDKISAGEISSQPIANLCVLMAWGSGPGGWNADQKDYTGAIKTIRDVLGTKITTWKEAVPVLNKRIAQDERKLFEDLYAARKKYLIDLNQKENINGWLNGWKKIYERNVQLITGQTNNILPLAAGVGIALAAVLIKNVLR